MSDSLQHSFEGLSMGRPPQASSLSSGNSLPARSSTGTLNAGGAFSQTFSGSSTGFLPASHAGMSTSSGNSNHALQGASDPQSASARFERIFNPTSTNAAGPSSYASDDFNGSTSPYKQYQPLPGTMAPANNGGSVGALNSGGAFGAYGQPFQPQHSNLSQPTMNMANPFASNIGMPAIRPKASANRQGLPPQWGSGSEDAPLVGASGMHAFMSPHASYFGPPPGSTGYAPIGSPHTSNNQASLADDDIIPTAIVVKNIPFSIKREQLLQIIEELRIPMPYAFNYHFDQGVFRGLAFANFRSGEEADAVVAALNGFDVAGRKLRVEYKKVLQAGEKERIEKEKAIKRMQSMQMEKERMRRQTVTTGVGEDWSSHFGPAGPPAMAGVPQQDGKIAGLDFDEDSHSDLAADAASELSGRKEDLDLNDPATLEIYSRVLLFKDDRMRDELSFSRNLTPMERRIVEMVSEKLNLFHYSSGDGDERFVTVTKAEVSSSHRPLRNSTSIIGRNHRGESSASSNSGLLGPSGSGINAARNGLRMKKSAPDMKRPRDRNDDAASFAHVHGIGMPAGNSGAATNSSVYPSSIFGAGGNLSRKSNGNLRDSYVASMGRRSNPTMSSGTGMLDIFGAGSSFDVPPVPALPSHTLSDNAAILRASHTPSPTPIGGERASSANSGTSAVNGVQGSSGNSNGNGGTGNGLLPATSAHNVLRQPAGPGPVRGNFAQRSRNPLTSASGSSEDEPGVHAGDTLSLPAGQRDIPSSMGTAYSDKDGPVVQNPRSLEPLET